ncbi:hypothetical protein GCM10023149_00050 [Mucilaginibacter gynuensis]|uniref:Gliding motility-associated-like protein n=1 Tax=Mucilaginibacter gynuensis TaxID=1302236 RepID=A0ABP8FLJ0_9SPHI
MTKRYLFKVILLCVLLCQFFTKASAQYAIGGSAGTSLARSVYWLTWDKLANGSTLITQPVGADASNIINGTYVWQFSPTVRITAVISNEVSSNSQHMSVYTPGSYSGDGLDLIYSGNNQPKPDSRGVPSSGLATPYGQTVKFDIDIKVAILINNVWTNVAYPGMIIADAESIDAGGEFISGDTPNSIAWQLLNKRTQNSAADDHYKLDLSNGGKSFKLYADLLPGNFGVQAVMFAHNASKLNNVSMKGSGLTAMAIGFVLPFDLGDAPVGYGTTGHYIDSFQITDYYAGDGTYAVVDYNTTPLVPQATVYIGANNVDADGLPNGTPTADSDNLIGNNDENTFTPASLPDVRVNQAGDIVFNIPVTNTKGVPATLRTWLDFNGDGVFGADEVISVTVPANTVNKTFTVTFPNAFFVNKIKVGNLYARIRVTTTNLIDDIATTQDERSISFAADGEAEDYKLKDILGITISGTVFNDGNGGLNNVISGTGINNVSGSPLYAYLVDDKGVIVNKSAVGVGGTYSFPNSNNGTYTVAISTNDVVIGGALAEVSANLPANWKPSGAAYGVNNAENTGIQTGTPNLQIKVKTPGTSLNVTGVSFGLNQIPLAVDDNGTTTAGQAITLTIPANDTDADGTIDKTTVLLVDPVDNLKKTSVTIAGQGTYTVNTANGNVTFTPLPTFAGKAIPVQYSIKDNFGSESVNALISVTVKPTGVNDTDFTAIGVPVTTAVKANDGQDAVATTVTPSPGAHGTTAVDATGRVIYTPAAGYVGTDTYTYILTTADGVVSDPVTVTISIKPMGVNDDVTTPINTPVTTTVTANDGPSGTGATITPTNGLHGTTTVDATGKVTYTPNTGYIGKDTYTYTITKGGATSDPVTVNVNIKPVGVNDQDATPINTPVTTAVKSNDGASGVGTVVKATPGANGVTTVDADGKITYTPVAGFVGNDKYTYTLTTPDGVESDPITVDITVYSSSMTLTKRATNTGSKAGDIINYTLVVTNTGTSILNNVKVADAGVDAGSISPANIASIAPGATATVTARYTLTQDDVNVGRYSNQASVSGTDQNGKAISDPLSDDPTTSTTDDPTVVLITQGGKIEVVKTGVQTANYISYTFVVKNTGNVTLTDVTLTDGNLGLTNTPLTIPAGGLLPGASITTPAFRYTLSQADRDAGVVNNTATVSGLDPVGATVSNSAGIATTVPASPVAINDAAQTSLNKAVNIDVSKNDDPKTTEFNLGSVEITKLPEHGTVEVSANGIVTYKPNAGYTGPDTFNYRVKDLYGIYTNEAVVNITVTPTAELKIPTLFTPNGDGINDVFEIRGLDGSLQNKLTIVNRWGNEVYKQTNYQNNWAGDGLNEGTYYYLLQVRGSDSDNWIVYKGYITLMRSLKK